MKRKTFPTLFNDRERSNLTFSEMMDEMMEDFFEGNRRAFIPELNIFEEDSEFEITVALPGMNKDDIDISLEGNMLTISGERELTKEENKKYHRIESRFGEFERSVPLPKTIDKDKINASYENGVLTITIPKHEEKMSKKIEVS